MRTSAVATSFFKMATPWLRLRSSTRPRLLRLTARNGADTPGAASRAIARVVSPAGAGVLPVVTAAWAGRPRVELTGWVPSREMRDAAVRAVAREAVRLGRRVRVVDQIEIIDRPQQRRA